MAWQGPAAGLPQTGTGGHRASHGLARFGCRAAPAPLAFASLGWGPAGRGALGHMKMWTRLWAPSWVCVPQWFGGTSTKPRLGHASLQGSPNLVWLGQ
eukprot:1850307-Alexandrium_andersonii.AAC.1